MSVKQRDISGVVYAFISSISFGLLPFFSIPIKAEGMSTESLMFYRFFLASLILGIFLLIRRRSFRITKRQLRDLVLIGGFGYGVTALTLVSSYDYIPSGIGTTIGFMFPVFVAVFMWVFYKERLNKAIYISLLLSIFGVFLLSYSPSGGLISGYGIFLLMLTNVFYGSYIIGVNKSSISTLPSSISTFYVILISMFLCLGLSLFRGSLSPIPSFQTGISLSLMAIITTIISNLTLIMAIKAIGPTITALLSPLEPLTAIVLGIIVFGEVFNFQIGLGVIIIILAVSLVVKRNK